MGRVARGGLDVGFLLQVDQPQLLDPQDAVLEESQAEDVAFAQQHLPPDDFILGEEVAPELHAPEEADIPLEDLVGDVDDLVLGIEVLDRHDIGVKIAEIAEQLAQGLDAFFPDLGAVGRALDELDLAENALGGESFVALDFDVADPVKIPGVDREGNAHHLLRLGPGEQGLLLDLLNLGFADGGFHVAVFLVGLLDRSDVVVQLVLLVDVLALDPGEERMGHVLLDGVAQNALLQLGLADEQDLTDADLGPLVDLEGDIHLVLALLFGDDLDDGGPQALLGQKVLDGLLDLLQLERAVIAVGQEILVLLLQLVGDIVFLDLAARLVGDRLDQRSLLDRDLDDPAAGRLGILDFDVGEEARRPKHPEILLQQVFAEIIPLPRGEIIHDRFLGDPFVAGDVDPLDQLLAKGGQGQKHAKEDEPKLLHDLFLITQRPGFAKT